MSKIILITGASSGFGKAIAEKFAAGGWNLILTARRKEKLEAVATAIEQKYKVKTLSLIFDVQNKEAVFQQIGGLPTEWQAIDLLVNNAGLALGRDSFENANIEDWETMIDTNVKGLLYTSKATLPYLIKNQGHIINIGSTAAKEVYPNGNVYCATKHAVDSLNQAMRMDLNPFNIRVGAIHPGMVDTEFSTVRFKGDKERANNVYKGFSPLQAEDLADIIHFVVSRPYHVNIADLVVMPTAQAMSGIVKRSL